MDLTQPGRREKPLETVWRGNKVVLHQCSNRAVAEGWGWVGGWPGGGVENHLTSCCKGALRVSLFIRGEMKGAAENCISFRAFLSFHLSRLPDADHGTRNAGDGATRA